MAVNGLYARGVFASSNMGTEGLFVRGLFGAGAGISSGTGVPGSDFGRRRRRQRRWWVIVFFIPFIL